MDFRVMENFSSASRPVLLQGGRPNTSTKRRKLDRISRTMLYSFRRMCLRHWASLDIASYARCGHYWIFGSWKIFRRPAGRSSCKGGAQTHRRSDENLIGFRARCSTRSVECVCATGRRLILLRTRGAVTIGFSGHGKFFVGQPAGPLARGAPKHIDEATKT